MGNTDTAGLSSRPSHLVRLGRTDLYVSRLCQGTAFRTSPARAYNELVVHALDRCIELGVSPSERI